MTKLSPYIDRILNPYHYERLKRILQLFEESNKVLDIGCDGGYYTSLLAKKSKLTIGVDYSPSLLGQAMMSYKGGDRLEFVLMDALHLGFADRSFDAVTSFDVIEHLMNDDEFLDEIYRVLKPGGFILITTPID